MNLYHANQIITFNKFPFIKTKTLLAGGLSPNPPKL